MEVRCLDKLPDDFICSEGYKDELAYYLKKLFSPLKDKGINKLKPKSSTCVFCHPNGKAYEFYNPLNGDFIFRYVFVVEKCGFLIIEPCKNNPIPDGPNGEPF